MLSFTPLRSARYSLRHRLKAPSKGPSASAKIRRRPERRRRLKISAVVTNETLMRDKQIGETLDKKYDKIFDKTVNKRRVGIVLHPTSLPGPYGCGEIGKEAFRFVDWLHSCGCQCWQVLPLVPPDQMFYSPYTGLDANCGNPLLISLDLLIEEGLLRPEEAPEHMPMGHADFKEANKRKAPLLSLAADRLLGEDRFHYLREEMGRFREKHAWIEDSALFEVLRSTPDLSCKVWWDWPESIRFRTADALDQARRDHGHSVDQFIAVQFLFDRQWMAVKHYANSKGIKIIGDMPIYVGTHSADVWANQRLFELFDSGAPALVSGVPPDAFSKTGQLWGTPLYKWRVHQEEGYSWWAQRLGRAFEMFDQTRIDHFRGFAGYYAVEAHRDTAVVGDWKKGPGKDLFDALQTKLGPVIEEGIIAEDLGVITPDVHKLRREIDAPGMVVLQFAFGSDGSNTHLPHLHYKNSIVYPGTHDNPTTVGWFSENTQPDERKFMMEYIGCDESDVAWSMIRASMRSVSDTCIICLQDVMRLDNRHRMNFPGRAEDNWTWRVDDYNVWDSLKKEAEDLKRLARIYYRLPEQT